MLQLNIDRARSATALDASMIGLWLACRHGRQQRKTRPANPHPSRNRTVAQKSGRRQKGKECVNAPMMKPNAPRPRHPFRATLPQLASVPVSESDSDLKLFAVSFTAFFICFYTFIL